MEFTYGSLKAFEKTGESLGKWSGLQVFPASKYDLKNKGNGVYYILYDDANVIVKRVDDVFYAYGTVDRVGSVDEWGRKEVYKDFSEKKKKPVATATATAAPAVSMAVATEPVVGDVKLGIDVDDVLKNAREMSIDSLLVGFNYGL
jgi:hypothetical protein